MRNLLSLIILFASSLSYGELSAPDGFVIQPLNLTNGSALKPNEWHYSEQHRSKGSLRWVLSKEDSSKENGAYETGVSINLMLGFSEKYGMSSQELTDKLISQITSYGEIIERCEPEDIGNMKRICIEKLEQNESGNTYHVMYTFMWWPDSELVAYTSAGTTPELWSTHQETFDIMSEIEVIGDLELK